MISSTVTDELDCGGAVQEALLAVRREVYPRYELGGFKSLVTLKLKEMNSS
jgi:hypothetical protein